MASTAINLQFTSDLEPTLSPTTNTGQEGKKINDLQEIIIEQAGPEVWKFISPLLDENRGSTLLMATSTRFNVLNQKALQYQNLINLKRINDVRYLNKFFESINILLPEGGLYVNS